MNLCTDVSLIRITVLVLIILFVFGLLTYSELFKMSTVKEDNTLILAHVFFRNGESIINDNRNPFSQDIPSTMSELTNDGRSMMFELGLELRRNYLNFIGKDYSHALMELTSLNTKVSRDSLMLVLAGLFPLRGSKTYPSGLNQQRILINLVNTTDSILQFLPESCPKFDQLYNEVVRDETNINLTKQYGKHFDDLRNLTNNIPILHKAFLLDYNIESGLKPPEWLNEIYPHPTKLLTEEYLRILTSNEELKRVLSGSLLSKITNDTIERINGSTQRKMHLYSVEKYNLEYLVRTLGIIGVDEIEKASYLSLEVHNFEGYFFIKVVFKKHSNQKPTVVELPYCGKICPLHYFIEMNKKYLSTENMCEL